MKYKTVRIYDTTFSNIDKLSKKYNVSKTELFEAMENYFYTTGISPFETSDVTSEFKKLKNQLISFIRTNEKEKINPMIKKVDIISERLIEFFEMNSFDEHTKLINGLASFILEKHLEIIKKLEDGFCESSNE